jgi:hypothetical protein
MPQCHNCAEPATTQASRHLTDAEYAALPENFLPIDGYAVQAVFACDDCADEAGPRFSGFCEHPEPAPVACPKCKAVGEQPCTMKNGDPRWTQHQARVSAQPPPRVCRHAHRANCAVFTGCQCATADEPPARPRTRMQGAAPGPEVSGLTIPVNVAQDVLAAAGHPWPSVVSVRSMLTQDNRPAIGADVYQFDATGTLVRDAHGHPVTADVVLPLPATGRLLS